MATTNQEQAPGGGRRGAGRTVATWGSAALLAGTSAVAAFRVADADGPTPVPQLLAFLPWLLVPAGLGLLCALPARRPALAVWGAGLAALLTWYTAAPGAARPAEGAPVAALRVLTANLQFGRAAGALVDLVRREEPDLVFVQECDPHCVRELGAALAGTHPHHHAVEARGPAGSVILSRWPLTPAEGVPAEMGQPGAFVDADGHRVRLQLAHPSPPTPGRLAAWRAELDGLRRWAREQEPGERAAREQGPGKRAVRGQGPGERAVQGGAAAEDTPVIVAGDFNASRDHAAFRRLLHDGGLGDAAALAGAARTSSWPVTGGPTPGVQIDHVLVSAAFTARDARFLRMEGSDHRALLVTLALHR
ncbi:endonuclease/exonuclease/phosphatase family protein [Streptomyces fragilis]|uniref:Endonuclease/exonuclease/phosphatase family protein n=1 Tax=Streptomyces fragilis TaxID=67301 RepID=A0ABV2YFD6_9ACTN|nr:endonuclease/exonuclease/phosphatase family protein [Streptomyces fragilis]